MKVVVASRNPVKVEATRSAFASQFPGVSLDMIPVEVDSGAGDQPDSDAATRQGARTRAERAREQVPDAEFWVGLEGGGLGEARSTTLPLPPAVRELVDAGVELGVANDRVFSTLNSKQGGGAFGLLTDGLYTRESVYREALVMALVPFVNELFPESGRQARD
jgi:non-canonical (house-cleaning) NTP pyrophosphatase